MVHVRVYVRNGSLSLVGELDDYVEATVTPRHNAVGAWALTAQVPADSHPLAAALTDPLAGILFVAEGETLLSGPIHYARRVRDAQSDVYELAGPCDTHILTERVAAPVPTGPPYSAQAYDVRTGPAETVLKQYLDANAGPGAIASRRVTGLTIPATAGLGATVTGRARWQDLLTLFAELAEVGNVGFRIVQAGASLEFRVYVPTDKSASIRFSEELGNLVAYSYRREAPQANYVYAGGGGEGTARTIAESGDSASIAQWGRAERFIDQRHTSDAGELAQAISEELERSRAVTSLSIEPVDTAQVAYQTDYGLGDRVTVVVDGVAIADVVREVTIRLRPDSHGDVIPTVGNLDTVSPDVLALRRLDSRVANLERR